MIHNGKYKIADFGFSKKIDSENRIDNFTVLGTRMTMAPEVSNNAKYGIKVIFVFI
jgi:serine/threonine protein kinase